MLTCSPWGMGVGEGTEHVERESRAVQVGRAGHGDTSEVAMRDAGGNKAGRHWAGWQPTSQCPE